MTTRTANSRRQAAAGGRGAVDGAVDVAMRICALPALLLGLFAGGCAEEIQAIDDQTEYDTWLQESLTQRGKHEGIIAQHTLYDYHFDRDGEALNDLGRHDLEILAEHYRTHSGQLNVRRGRASDSLYQARREHVRLQLAEVGLAAEQVVLGDDYPGGRGLPAGEAMRIYDVAKQPPPRMSAATVGGGAAGGGAMPIGGAR